ncbi:MAG: class I SAM-dependent methyltransferase [Candidatus Krumholzibacteria bacterium]|nr:class I SAM-dependent methyltransferase [Candidatus Krumholzibacteria bacterium]
MYRNLEHDVGRITASLADLRSRFDPDFLNIFVEELLTWNPQLGLVSKRSTAAVVSRLVRQSVDLWEFVAGGVGYRSAGPPWRVADIGSGAGFPGLVWKGLVPSLRLILIERKSRRAMFLERTVHRLDFRDTEVVEADLKEVVQGPRGPGGFDLAVTLAVASPPKVGKLIEQVLKPGCYYVTVRPVREKAIDPHLATCLRLHSTAKSEKGTFLLYQKT